MTITEKNIPFWFIFPSNYMYSLFTSFIYRYNPPPPGGGGGRWCLFQWTLYTIGCENCPRPKAPYFSWVLIATLYSTKNIPTK